MFSKWDGIFIKHKPLYLCVALVLKRLKSPELNFDILNPQTFSILVQWVAALIIPAWLVIWAMTLLLATVNIRIFP